MFNSQKINNDPTPWAIYDNDGCFTGDLTCTPSSIRSWETVKYTPRPEYDNNPNRILVAFRENTKQGEDLLEHAKMQISILDYVTGLLLGAEQGWEPIHSEEHMKHARKVLTRLVNIFGTEN